MWVRLSCMVSLCKHLNESSSFFNAIRLVFHYIVSSIRCSDGNFSSSQYSSNSFFFAWLAEKAQFRGLDIFVDKQCKGIFHESKSDDTTLRYTSICLQLKIWYLLSEERDLSGQERFPVDHKDCKMIWNNDKLTAKSISLFFFES